jgi:hypothetical protein
MSPEIRAEQLASAPNELEPYEMRQRTHFSKGTGLKLALLAAALQVLAVMPARRKKVRVIPRRLAASLAFSVLFFAGASLSAGAGNTVAQLLESGDETQLSAESTTTSTEEAPAAEAPAEEADGDSLARAGGAPSSGAEESASEPAPAEQPAEPAAPVAPAAPAEDHSSDGNAWQARSGSDEEASHGHADLASNPGTVTLVRRDKPSKWVIRQNAFRRSAPPVIEPRPLAKTSDRDPEIYEPGVSATFWLYRRLPDPTPPSRRLKPQFAQQLSVAAKRARVDWALVLGVLRARGERGAVPATPAELRALSSRLARLGARRSPWSAALALEGRTAFADRAVALQHYNHAVGLRALVKGLQWAKPHLAKTVLNDSRISIYPGGRYDISGGKTDIRILVLLRYLAEAHGSLTVSSLTTGHRVYSRPGVVSAHMYGLAVDISALGGLSIMGNSAPGGLTEQGVRNILLLPSELQPRQVISLLGMGGPSFPMGNHDDHIHVGY